MQALILTGGMGTRLRPLTMTTLKPLLPIANVAFLHYPLASLRKAGVREAALCIGADTKPYRRMIQEQKKWGTRLSCSTEKKSLGTGGAIKNAEAFIRSTPFFAMNGDSLTDLDFSLMLEKHRKNEAAATLALIEVDDASQYGLVQTDPAGRVLKFVEKPSERAAQASGRVLINGGMYILERSVLDLIPKGSPCSIEREIFPELIKRGWPIFGFIAAPQAYWLDIGTPQKYMQGNIDVILGKIRPNFPAGAARRMGPGCKIHAAALVGDDAVLGKKCSVGKNSVLRNCVLLDQVKVGQGVLIENCVIGNLCSIGDFSRVSSARILGERSFITPYSRL